MPRKYEIGIVGDTGPFEKALRNGVIEPLEDAEDAFKDLQRASDRGDLDGDIKKAQRTTEDLKEEIDDTRAALGKLKFAAQDVGDAGASGMGRVKEGAQELQQEVGANLGEAVSSFRGDMADLGQVGQDTLGGLAATVAGMGPAGLAGAFALAGGAAGLGILTQGINDANEKAQDLKESAGEFAEVLMDPDPGAVLEYAADQMKELATTTEEGKRSLSDWVDLAEKYGIYIDAAALAQSGLSEVSEDYIQQLRDQADELERQNGWYTGQGDRIQALRDTADAYETNNEKIKQAHQSEKDWMEYGGAEAELKAELVGEIADAYDGVRDAAIDAATSEKGVFDPEKWATYVEEHKKQVEQYQTNLSKLKLTPEQWENLMALPEAERMKIVDSLANGPENAKPRIISALTDAGSEGAQGAQVAFDKGFAPEADVEVSVSVDDEKAKASVKELGGDITPSLKPRVARTEYGQAKKSLDDLAKDRVATINAKANTKDATNTMASWRRDQEARPVYITVKTRAGKAQEG